MARPTENPPTPQEDVIYHSTDYPSGDQPQQDRREVADREEKITIATLTGGSSVELVAGGAAVVLAIIGLTGNFMFHMSGIATIAIGGALLAHGAAVAARWNDTVRRAVPRQADRGEVAGGVGSEMLGGAAGIALGILALADVAPLVLLPVAAIVFGGALLLGSPVQPDLARIAPDRDPRVGRITYQAVEATSGAMALCGVGSVVLGILALIHVGPVLRLTLVAMLAIGGALLLVGGALATRFARTLQQVR